MASSSIPVLPRASSSTADNITLQTIDDILKYIREVLCTLEVTPSVNLGNPNVVDESLMAGQIELWSPKFDSLAENCKTLNTQVTGGRELTNQTLKVMSCLLEGMGNIHWVAAALSFMAFILRSFQDVEQNRKECLHLLWRLYDMAKNVNHLYKNMSNHSQEDQLKLKHATSLMASGVVLCGHHMQSSKFYRLFNASVMKQNLQDISIYIDHEYQTLQFTAVEKVAFKVNDLMQKVPGPYLQLKPGYPEHAVGLHEKVEEVMKLLEFGKGESVSAVCLHGMGGIGKSTLGDAVYARLNGSRISDTASHCKVTLELQVEKNNLKELQKQILEKLGGKASKVANDEEGRALLEELFQNNSKPIFLFIDNVPCESFLGKLLPRKKCLPAQSRILLTTRYATVCEILKGSNGLINSSKLYNMKGLSLDQSMELMRRALKDDGGQETSLHELEAVMKACDGLPLALEVASRYIKTHKHKDQACQNVVESMKRGSPLSGGKDDELVSCLEFMINQLSPSARQAFYEILNFDCLSSLEWHALGCILGEHNLETLERRAMVHRKVHPEDDLCGKVQVHDVLASVGRNKCTEERYMEGKAISKKSDLDRAIHNKIESFIMRDKSNCTVRGKDLRSMINLRILSLRNITVKGTCEVPLSLQLLVTDSLSHIPFKLMKAKKLKVIDIRKERLFNFKDFTFPQNVEVLYLEYDIMDTPVEEDLTLGGGCSSLKSLTLSEIPNSRIRNLEKLRSLRLLRLHKCLSLDEVEGLGQLSSLEVLSLKRADSLTCLPESLSLLSNLRSLTLRDCKNLKMLPKLPASLQRLNLHSCPSLKMMPELPASLQLLHLTLCPGLKILPQLPASLRHLYLQLICLKMLLSELPASLQHLCLRSCLSLKILPELPASLQYLNLHYCPSLKALPELPASLQHLSLKGCRNLK